MPIILLIDDNKMLSLVEARYIQRAIANVDILVPSQGCCSLEMASTKNPDVTILDTGILDRDPMTVYRSLCEYVPPETILITSNTESEPFAKLKAEKKIHDLLIRPFAVDTLIHKVEAILVGQGHTVIPYKSSVPPPFMAEAKHFDRHLALNQLSGIMGAIRALEAEIQAEPNTPNVILELLDEYVPRVVELVNDVSKNIKRTQNSEH